MPHLMIDLETHVRPELLCLTPCPAVVAQRQRGRINPLKTLRLSRTQGPFIAKPL